MRFEFKTNEPHSYFAPTPQADVLWESWVWQMQNRLSEETEFSNLFKLSAAEEKGFKLSQSVFKISATPYYSSLAATSDPIRRIVLPTAAEKISEAQEMLDPLGEDENSPHPRLVHRYSDRVLFLITDTCSVYCRFCTRKRFTGQDQGFINSKEYSSALDYIKKHSGIREVIFSGGDPLTLSNKLIDKILTDVRAIDHIEIIRFGTRMPVVCPMRIDKELTQILRKHAPVFIMSHFNHPKELTAEAARALGDLVDSGIPVFNQSVLLNGVNNHVNIIQALNRRLLYLRVKPYYLFQCDPSEGTDHLRTTIESSEEILKEMWGHFSGLAMGNFSVDIPAGGGKATLVPDFVEKKSKTSRDYKGWDGKRGTYVNPVSEVVVPSDALEYAPEWEALKNSKLSQTVRI